MKSTATFAAVLVLVGLVSACSSSPDEACETVSEDVVLGISQGMDSGSVIVGDPAGIRDGDWWDVAGVIDVGGTDNQVAVWRVRQDPAEPSSVGPVSASDLFAANYSDWPTNLLDTEIIDRAASCVSA